MESESSQVFKRERETYHGSVRSYTTGFLLSIACTITAYLLVYEHSHAGDDAFSHLTIWSVIIALALVQFAVQLFFFLHLGWETKPRWKLLVLGFMILVVCILVFGSLWIMNNLNYRMTPQQINTYMQNQDGGI